MGSSIERTIVEVGRMKLRHAIARVPNQILDLASETTEYTVDVSCQVILTFLPF